MKKTPTVLCILDGFGLNPDYEGNAIKHARTPNFEYLWANFPHQVLITHGERIGLPAGSMGTSEVGHLNIGLGRVVEQWLTQISRQLREDALPSVPEYQQFTQQCRSRTIHLIGLVSDGGVHSHLNHLFMLISRLRKDVGGNIVIHAITDGRDTSAQGGVRYLRKLESFISTFPNVSLATAIGRIYTMDRDTRWERVEKGYRLMVDGVGEQVPEQSFTDALLRSYAAGTTDEFIEPLIASSGHTIKADDALLFFNFREDRMREIAKALTQSEFTEFSRSVVIPKSRVLCFTEYDRTFELPFIFKPQSVDQHLGEVLSKNDMTQLRIAETEKYAHVTYFMNGKVEAPYPGEDRLIIPSNREVKTYDQIPEMCARGVCDATLDGINSGKYDFIVVNFANCDMVGHTGVLEAAVKAVEVVDGCLGEIYKAIQSKGGNLVVMADHGNAEQMINYEDGSPHTSHTKFVVPFIVARFDGTKQTMLREDGSLCDVAPTILEIFSVEKPSLMTGRSLLT